MIRVFKPFVRFASSLIALAIFAVSLTGCVSTYSNTQRFSQPPHPGMTELAMLQKFGAPDFMGFVEDQKVYVYKVRDSKYIIAVGQYSGRDLIITVKGGVIKSVEDTPRSQSVTFFYAAPWMGRD